MNQHRHPIRLFLVGILASVPQFTSAQTLLDSQAKALTIISDFAEKLCTPLQASGSRTDIELSVEAKAELLGVVKKIADLGFGAATKYKNATYEGLLQADLSKHLRDREACKQKVWDDLKDRLLPKPQPQGFLQQPAGIPRMAIRDVRLLQGVEPGLSLLEITIENQSTRPLRVNSVDLRAEHFNGGESCLVGPFPSPMQEVAIDWKTLLSAISEKEDAVWTVLYETPIRVSARARPGGGCSYSDHFSMSVPTDFEVKTSGLTRFALRMKESEMPVDIVKKDGTRLPIRLPALSRWHTFDVSLTTIPRTQAASGRLDVTRK